MKRKVSKYFVGELEILIEEGLPHPGCVGEQHK
jgi:hypothetical protein